jgi:hypothetical protein
MAARILLNEPSPPTSSDQEIDGCVVFWLSTISIRKEISMRIKMQGIDIAKTVFNYTVLITRERQC